jgi:hypothetical protein
VFVRLDFVALGANLVVAHLALPLRRQETATLADRALSDKLSLLGGRGLVHYDGIRHEQFVNLVPETFYAFVVFTNQTVRLFSVRQYDLRVWQKTLFALKQDVLSVTLELMVPERLCTCRIYEFAIPYILALHTMRVGGNLRQVLLDARPATLQVAVVTRHFFVAFFVEPFATYCAV